MNTTVRYTIFYKAHGDNKFKDARWHFKSLKAAQRWLNNHYKNFNAYIAEVRVTPMKQARKAA